MILSELLAGNARRVPDDLAYTFEGESWTWRQTNERVNRLAGTLRAAGVAFGERAIVLADNSHRYIETLYALAKLGIIAVPMNPKSILRDVEFIAGETDAVAIIISDRIAKRLGDHRVVTAPMKIAVGWGPDHGLASDYERLVAAGDPAEIEAAFGDDALRTIKFTSGTTGQPKGCIATHRSLFVHVYSYLVDTPDIPERSTGLIPLSISTGLALNTLCALAYRNARTIITDRFDPPGILDLVASERVERITAVPTMIGALTQENEARPRDLSALKGIFYSGAPASVPLMRRAVGVLQCGFFAGYGSTESGGNVTYLSPGDHVRLLNEQGDVTDVWGRSVLSCGRETPGAHVRLVDDDLRDVAPGAVGELFVHASSLFEGYWNRPDDTAKALRDGWLLTGDLGRRDADGFFYIVDRKRDMIVSGGYNVYAIEVESVLGEYPTVAEAAVVGIFDSHWGEAVHAFVMPKPGCALDPAELLAHCKGALAAPKVPKVVHVVADFPRTTSGKVRKGELRTLHRPADQPDAPLMA
ncbi:MAG TPA: AMP-binding protein [Candidatus Lustribacter sp.]